MKRYKKKPLFYFDLTYDFLVKHRNCWTVTVFVFLAEMWEVVGGGGGGRRRHFLMHAMNRSVKMFPRLIKSICARDIEKHTDEES